MPIIQKTILDLLMKNIYLDNNAMTPCDPEVIDLIQQNLSDHNLGNPSSNHFFGWEAHKRYETAKENIANIYNALADDVIFTSGASEANNQAILGLVQAAKLKNLNRKKILVSAIEHKCVLNAAQFAFGIYNCKLETIPVHEDGIIDLNALRELLTDEVLLVSVMAVNNEIGTVQPYAEIGKLCRLVGAIFHVDAAQASYEDIDIISNNIDLLSLSGAKVYGPAGVGVLIIDSMLTLKPVPLIHGGLQQGGLRSGTIPLYLCEAMSHALSKMNNIKPLEKEFLLNLRHYLINTLKENNIDFSINGSLEKRHPGNLNISIRGISNDTLVQKLQPQFAVSTGSACNSGIIKKSHVLSALGLKAEDIVSAIRIGIGRFNTKQDIQLFAEKLKSILQG